MGVLPDGQAMVERLTARELLILIGKLRSIPAVVLGPRIHELLEVMAERTLVVDESPACARRSDWRLRS